MRLRNLFLILGFFAVIIGFANFDKVFAAVCTSNEAVLWDGNPGPFISFVVPCNIASHFKVDYINSAFGTDDYTHQDYNGGSASDYAQGYDALSGYADTEIKKACAGGSYTRYWKPIGSSDPATIAISPCQSLSSSMQVCINGTCDGTVAVPEGGSYTVTWKADKDFPGAARNCSFTGSGVPNSDQFTGNNVLSGVSKGMYTYTLTCQGIINGATELDAQNNPREGSITKTIRANVGNVQAPRIASFEITPDSFEKSDPKVTKLTASWQIENFDSVESITLDGSLLEKTPSGSKTLSVPAASKNYVLRVKGKYDFGDITAQKTVSVSIPPRSKITTLKANPETIKVGEASTLTWDVADAATVSISPTVGTVQSSGSIQVFPTFTTRYVLEAKSRTTPDSPATRSSVVVRVSTDVATLPDIVETPITTPVKEVIPEEKGLDLKVEGTDGPVTLSVPASFQLSWNTDAYCLSYGEGFVGVHRKAGSETVTVSRTGTFIYKMYCPGLSPSNDAVTVTVTGTTVIGTGASAVRLPIAEASASVDGKTFTNSIRVIRGRPTHVWLSASHDVTGDKRASRDAIGGWARVQEGRCLVNYDLNQGTPTFEGVVFYPEGPQDCDVELGDRIFNDAPGTYRYGVLRLAQGDGLISDIGYITVVVVSPPPPKGPPVINLKVNGESGTTVSVGVPSTYTVNWDVTDADTCTASGIWSGDKPTAGQESFFASVKKTIVYSLSCTGKLGTTNATVNVKLAEVPICDFTALPKALNTESVFIRESELSWTCRFSDSCSMSPDVGAGRAIFGTTRVSPDTTTTYRLTCKNSEATKAFESTVEVR